MMIIHKGNKIMELGVLFGLLLLHCVTAVPLRLFYPYGLSKGDESLFYADDVSSSEIQLKHPVHFYQDSYNSLFVNGNGHISFGSELPVYQPTMVIPLDLGVKVLAAFLADVDISLAGEALYRESTEEALLQRAGADVQAHFGAFPDFVPDGLFIATWDKVASYKGDRKVINTFQIVIASDSTDSFVIINYLDDGIAWLASPGKYASIREDPPAQAGFDSGSNNLYLSLPGSGTERAVELSTESNVNLPGVWMYRITNKDGGNVQGPDRNTGDVIIFQPELDKLSCEEGKRQCHSNAECVDYATGFCCDCLPPTYGNGRECIDPATPQRLNGKVAGVINDVTFENLDMHAFVVTKDGRAYTAISRVPAEISQQLMTLNTIGGIIGWMFSLIAGPGGKNGYMYTGGTFNRTARIKYQAGGEVVIEQRFFGHNVLNNIRMETYINGTIPDNYPAEKITVDDYNEEYTRVSPGLIRSTSDRTFRVNDIAQRYTWDQVIQFEECAFDPSQDERTTQRLTVSRNFVVYDSNDRVVRFASSNKIARMTGVDPCEQSTCDENVATCVPQGDSYTCECKTGYLGDGSTCEDVDECALELDTCDENAVCYNSPGSFQCQCNYGFIGDGRTCQNEEIIEGSGVIGDEVTCGEYVCHDEARCVFNDNEGKPMCECGPGYRGDGEYCEPVVFNCNEADICHENADCVFDDLLGEYACVCSEGFSGDGQMCEKTDIEDQCRDCGPNSRCVYDSETMVFKCACLEGYYRIEGNCVRQRETPEECENCDINANCIINPLRRAYECRCARGYQGNGYQCEPYDCSDADICDPNASCVEDLERSISVCVCNSGFVGNGYNCEAEGCNVLDNCDENAQCLPDPRDTSRYMCRCNPGFSGDGQICIRRVISCNEVNNCDVNAECVYDPQTTAYSCRCSRDYEGDGVTCRLRIPDCRRDPRMCDSNASCRQSGDTYMCICNTGYGGDGTYCRSESDEMSYLLFSRGYSIHKVAYKQNGDDTDGSRVLYVPDELAVAVASDCVEQQFYWTDVSYGRISRASLDGFGQERVVSGFKSPEGIAIDWIGRNIYVTDTGLDIIAVVNMNGTRKKTLVSDDVIDPRAIVLDLQRGTMYWTDWYRSKPAIERASMDGTDRQVFIDTDLGLPNGLTMDYYTQQLCWGDAGTNRIECVRSDGVGRRVITEDAPYPFDLSLFGNTIYWSDWTINGVPSVSRDGGESNEPLTLPVGGNGRLYGLAAVGDFCPRVRNPCLRNNGGCRYFCLPTPNGGRTCGCPDDVDEVTCSEIGIIRNKK